MSYSKSIFFIPVWFDDFAAFTDAMSKSPLWDGVATENFAPRYLLNYADRIAKNENLFRLFSLRDHSLLDIYTFERELGLKIPPAIEQVRFSCFSTGVGFMEFWMSYTDLTPEEITNFAYLFKKATKLPEPKEGVEIKSLYDNACLLVPENANAKLFFTAMAPFKYECTCFHFLHVDGVPGEANEARDRLCRLSRSYNTKISVSSESDYDMIYHASYGDQWGGSSEGLVNITYDFEGGTDYYLHNFKISHLSIDYYFLYLLLLNQRFTAIQYITDISTAFDKGQQEIDRLNRRIVELKTIFSFNVISDDKIFQNVYSRMYDILEIEKLLEDIVDNEGQIQILQNAVSLKNEKWVSNLLIAISLLSLFSVLIDAASLFDRFVGVQSTATVSAFITVGAVVSGWIIWLITRRK